MSIQNVFLRRIAQQRLAQNVYASPEEVVAWMGAVQAQDYYGAKWALGLRTQSTTDNQIEAAFQDGKILRTHVMRPTWHFVTPEDIRWMLELTAERVHKTNASIYRQLELDGPVITHSNEVITTALQGRHYRTRAELGEALNKAGIPAEGQRLGYLLHIAELEALICSGPRRGKVFTYALLDERAPSVRRLDREQALAELVRRYFTSHGPATVRDCAWWSGLTAADVKEGLQLVAEDFNTEEINGQTYTFSASLPTVPEVQEQAFLLPTYDELLVGYAGFARARSEGQDPGAQRRFEAMLFFGDRASGSWRRTLRKKGVDLHIAPFDPLTEAERAAIHAAAHRYGEFLDQPVIVYFET